LETTQKVEASLQQAIQEHVSSSDFSPSQGLDFLDVKNSLLLSYIIELVYDFRNRLLQGNTNENGTNGGGGGGGGGRDDASLHRLFVMRTVLDKMRGLDKKLRYQVRQEKVKAAANTS
jgi:Sas10/Utp3/C1D family